MMLRRVGFMVAPFPGGKIFPAFPGYLPVFRVRFNDKKRGAGRAYSSSSLRELNTTGCAHATASAVRAVGGKAAFSAVSVTVLPLRNHLLHIISGSPESGMMTATTG